MFFSIFYWLHSVTCVWQNLYNFSDCIFLNSWAEVLLLKQGFTCSLKINTDIRYNIQRKNINMKIKCKLTHCQLHNILKTKHISYHYIFKPNKLNTNTVCIKWGNTEFMQVSKQPCTCTHFLVLVLIFNVLDDYWFALIYQIYIYIRIYMTTLPIIVFLILCCLSYFCVYWIEQWYHVTLDCYLFLI